jgi:putative AdoMet-dependent methyltransferase
MLNDPFPPADFDAWAGNYDQSTAESTIFPFAGYEKVLETVVARAAARPGMSVLDLGTGTANLALLFEKLGCELWCSDFSPLMLEKARAKLPRARFALHDLRQEWPPEFDRRFDVIVSAYVFHHFELEKKVNICRDLLENRLAPGGKLIIADLSFANRAAMDAFAASIGELWEDEFYWLADETLAAFEKAGVRTMYEQVSTCAGVYTIQ